MKHVKVRALTVIVAVAAAATVLAFAGSAKAGMPAGGTVRVFVVPGQGQGQGTIVLVGAIGDYGKTLKADKNGVAEMILKKGTIRVSLAAMEKKLNNSKPLIENRTTCSMAFSATAPVRLFNGTGLYKGIAGTVMLTETFAGYGPFYKTGPRKGQCNTSNNAAPLAQYGSVQGVGTVNFR